MNPLEHPTQRRPLSSTPVIIIFITPQYHGYINWLQHYPLYSQFVESQTHPTIPLLTQIYLALLFITCLLPWSIVFQSSLSSIYPSLLLPIYQLSFGPCLDLPFLISMELSPHVPVPLLSPLICFTFLWCSPYHLSFGCCINVFFSSCMLTS